MFRSLTRGRDAAFVAFAAIASLATARVLPHEIAGLSPRMLTLLPAVIVFLAVAGWLAVMRPRTAFVLGFALLGFVRFEPAPVDAVFALLILGTFAVARVRPAVPPVIALPLACFTLVSLFSMVNAIDLHRAVKFEFTTLYGIALAVWLSWAFAKPEWLRTGMKTYLIVAVVSGLLGPIALYLPLPHRSFLTFGGVRALGFFKDPNVYSAFLVPAAVILLEELVTPRLLAWRRSVLLGAFAACGVGLVVAFSRAAWLNFALAAAALVVVLATRAGGIRRAAKSIAVLALGAAAGFGVLVASGSLSFFESRSHLQSYDQQRFSNQGSALDDVFRHAFGYGPGQAEVRLPLSTHSTFARTAYEQGLLGVTTFTLILLSTLLAAWVLARRRTDVGGIGTASLLGIWIGLIANSVFIDTLHWRHLWVFAGLIWCGYVAVIHGSPGSPEQRAAAPQPHR